MVLDKIENSALYAGLSKRIAKAFDYIHNTDLLNTEEGKYEIEGDNVFALIQEYETKNIEDCKAETHFKFIDIQYVISGEEQIGVGTLSNLEPFEKSEENDYAFYNTETTQLKLSKGMFAIFFPEDIHRPCVKSGKNSMVKKLVVKIRI